MEKWDFKDVTVYRFVCKAQHCPTVVVGHGKWCQSVDLALEDFYNQDNDEYANSCIIEIESKRFLLNMYNKEHMELYNDIVTYAKLRRENAERKQKKV